MTVPTNHPELQPMTGNQKVLAVFNAASRNSNNKASPETARNEVMDGYRPDAAEGSGKGKAKKSKKSMEATKFKSTMVSVSSVVLITGGLNQKGDGLNDTAVPTRAILADMELAGCAVVSDKQTLTFDSKWTYEDVDNFLRELLPLPFEYADNSVTRPASKTSSTKSKSAWVLLSKERRKLAVVPGVAKATGKELERFKGRDKAPVKDSHIYVALRKRIPRKVYNSWKPDTPHSTSDMEQDSEHERESGSASDTPSEASGMDVVARGMSTEGVLGGRTFADPATVPKRGRSSSDALVSAVCEIRESKKAKHAHVVNNKLALFAPGCESESDSTITTTRKVSGLMDHQVSTTKASAHVAHPPEYIAWSHEDITIYNCVLGHDAYGDRLVNPWLADYKIRSIDLLL